MHIQKPDINNIVDYRKYQLNEDVRCPDLIYFPLFYAASVAVRI